MLTEEQKQTHPEWQRYRTAMAALAALDMTPGELCALQDAESLIEEGKATPADALDDWLNYCLEDPKDDIYDRFEAIGAAAIKLGIMQEVQS